MKRALATLLLVLTALPGMAAAQGTDTGSIRYGFQTLVIFQPPSQPAITILKADPWFSAKAVPARAVVLEEGVALPGTTTRLDKGAVLSVAESTYFAACTDKVGVKSGVFGDGQLPVCLIDMDRDGVLDSWYRSSVPIMLSHYSGHIQRDDIHPLPPVKSRLLSIEEVRKLPLLDVVSFEYRWGTLTYCFQYEVCMTRQAKIKPAATEQTVDYMGGQFGYREVDKQHLAVRLIREPPEWIF